MRKAFVDTNVVLDFLLERSGADAAQRMLSMAEQGKLVLGYSFLSVAAYVIRRSHTKEEVRKAINDLCQILEVLSMDVAQIERAIANPMDDFEDSLQYQCAKAHGYDAIITSNKKHFPCEDVMVLTPEEFLTLYQSA